MSNAVEKFKEHIKTYPQYLHLSRFSDGIETAISYESSKVGTTTYELLDVGGMKHLLGSLLSEYTGEDERYPTGNHVLPKGLSTDEVFKNLKQVIVESKCIK